MTRVAINNTDSMAKQAKRHLPRGVNIGPNSPAHGEQYQQTVP